MRPPPIGYGRQPTLTLGLRLLALLHSQSTSDWCPEDPAAPDLPACVEPVVRYAVPSNSAVAADGGLGSGVLRAGEHATLNVSTRDNFGDPYRNSSALPYLVCATFVTPNKADPSPYAGGAHVSVHVVDWGDGNFTVRWLPTITGVYHAVVRMVTAGDGKVADCDHSDPLLHDPLDPSGLLPRTLVGAQPYYAVTVGSGPTVNDTIVVGGGSVANDLFLGKAVSGVPTTMQITASDLYGNRQTDVADESNLFYLEVSSGVAGFTGAWATVEGRRSFQGARIWVSTTRERNPDATTA